MIGFGLVWPRLAIPSERIAFFNTYKSYLVNRKQFKFAPRKMNLVYYSYLLGISFLNNNFMFELTEDVMSKLVAGGIPQYFAKFIETFILRPQNIVEEVEIIKCTLEDLEFNFVIYLIACGISSFVFLLEILFYRLKNLFIAYGLIKRVNSL